MKKINFQENILPYLPTVAGVYLMKDNSGKIIYIGKAKSIKKRVVSYFSGKKDKKTAILVDKIFNIETIITLGESEALLLENNLIKKHKPKYNINLKDGKTYPVLRITDEKWPVIYKTRSIVNDGSKYFGPFTNSGLLDIYLELIRKLYHLRKCRGKLKKRDKPCLYYHLGECHGPCIGAMDNNEYKSIISKIENFLSVNDDELKNNVIDKMNRESERLNFEKAAWYRDALRAIDEISKKQEIFDFNLEVRDYISFAEKDGVALFSVFQMRNGRMSGRDLFKIDNYINDENGLSQFICQYYEQYHAPPSKIFVIDGDNLLNISNYLNTKFNTNISVQVATNDRERSILRMGYENSRYELIKELRKMDNQDAVDELKKVLNLRVRPTRIEGFDISHLDGKDSVASLITFNNGLSFPSGYRSFNIKSTKGKIDDFESIREVIARRYSRLKNEGKKLPNLILVDGGAGQVSAANTIILSLELSIPVIGLAKREEEVFLSWQKEPIILPAGSDSLMLLQAIRDETHRFATKKSRKKRALRNL